MKTMISFDEAQKKHPKLMNELLSLEYVLTHGYSNNEHKDDLRHKEIQTIIYERRKIFLNLLNSRIISKNE